MYLREKKIKKLQIKNILIACLGVFHVFTYGFYIISEFVYYRDEPYIAWNATSMASSIVLFIVGSVLLIQALISRSLIGKATFFSGYFEGSLDGLVKSNDLAKVVGHRDVRIRKQMIYLRKRYMQKFELLEEKGEMVAELYSKKALCECKNCGATIEKRIFFTGTCPYCNSSDLFAKVLADNRFYSIMTDVKSGEKKPKFYLSGQLMMKKILYLILAGFSTLIATIGLLMVISEIPHYFDKEYQKELLLSPESHLYSYELIKADILDTILFAMMVVVVFTPLAIVGIKRVRSIITANICADFFSKSSRPFIRAGNLPDVGLSSKSIKKMKWVRKSIHYGDLVNCNLEVHEGELMVALAKKIVKDECHSCGGPIVGAVDENYVCKYCGRKIMGVVEKG